MFADPVTYPAAFIAGLLSFFSPCIVPLIPGYFTYISGCSLDDLTEAGVGVRQQVICATGAFVLGFSVVFILMGASASFIGGVLLKNREILRIAGGAVIILFGIHLTGLFRISQLDFERRIQVRNRPVRFLGTFLVGMAFGAGWSPCIGPLLGSILVIAGSREMVHQGMLLLGVYSAGLALPFLVLSVCINFLLIFIKKTGPTLKYVSVGAGIMLIALGFLLMTNQLNLLTVSI